MADCRVTHCQTVGENKVKIQLYLEMATEVRVGFVKAEGWLWNATVERLEDGPSGRVWKPEISSGGRGSLLCHIKFNTLKPYYL